MFTLYITRPLARKQHAISSPSLDAILCILRCFRPSVLITVRVWSSADRRFII
jgi:hypothetical protein